MTGKRICAHSSKIFRQSAHKSPANRYTGTILNSNFSSFFCIFTSKVNEYSFFLVCIFHTRCSLQVFKGLYNYLDTHWTRHTVGIRMTNKFDIWMVQTCPIMEWFIIQVMAGITIKSIIQVISFVTDGLQFINWKLWLRRKLRF